MARQGDGSIKPPSSSDPGDEATDKTLDGQSLSFGSPIAPSSKEALGETVDSEPGHRLTPSRGQITPSRVSLNPFPVAQWDRYEWKKLLGQGGMGAVYQARDRRLDRLVALKFIRNDDEQLINRFMQEARAQSRIDHPGICKVHEVGEVDGKAYIAMQFIDGVSLQQAARGMSMLDRVTVIRDAALALHSAHELGIIHRDIKPANIMVERTASGKYRPVIMDFGLAREAGDGKGLTESGAVMGTPAYMSPEQARGEIRRLDRRSDVYSLGATLYDILSGEPPFEDETVVNILLKVLTDDPKPLREKDPTIPEALDTIVGKCLNKEPVQRYQSAQELADDLGRFLGNERIVAKRVSLLYRLGYRARRNKPVAALVGALLGFFLVFVISAVRSRLESLRKEREAKAEAELAQKLGRYVKDLEWLVRTAYSLPLHDTTPDKALVRERMTEIEAEIRSSGEAGTRLGHYALGRGHLALHEWSDAEKHLRQAESLGYKDLELNYALGRVLGEKFSQALDDARKSGDKSFFEKRRKELEAEYLQPALSHLNRSRKLKTVSASYLEGLIDYYNGRYDAALINANFAQKQTPWLYEAIQLEGDVYMARAFDQKDQGDDERAEQSFHNAITHYERAVEIGRSDRLLHESIAEAWIRQEEMDQFRGRDPSPKMKQALAAADRAIEAAPRESHGYTKRAFAYLFLARYEQARGGIKEMIAATERIIESGEQAISIHPRDEYGHEVIGIAQLLLGGFQIATGGEYEKPLASARKSLSQAIEINPLFPWAYNDLGISYMLEGASRTSKNLDPENQFTESISIFRKALSLDPNYTYVYGNLTFIYNNLAIWRLERGREMAGVLKEVSANADKSIQMNKTLFVAYGNAGGAYAFGCMHKYFSLEDPSEYAKIGIDYLERLFSINENIPDSYVDLITIYYAQALSALRQDQDPVASIERGRQAVKKCLQVNKGDHPGCLAADALLFTVTGRYRQQPQKARLAALTEATNLTSKAQKLAAKDINVLLATAEVSYRNAEMRLALKQSPRREISDGLAASEQALQLASGWPRALALQGALRLLSAKTQTPGVERTAEVAKARIALTTAIHDNPLLKNLYGDKLAELDQLVAAEGNKQTP